MRRAPLLVAALLLPAALVGCFGPEDGAGDPSGVQVSDFVRVRFVERFANGTVHEATGLDDPAGNVSLDDLPSDAGTWWLMWAGFDRFPTGEKVLTNVRLVDLDADGSRETMSRFRHDVDEDALGQQQLINQEIVLWHLPPAVEEVVQLPAQGLYDHLVGLEPGDRVRNVTLGQGEAFGSRSEGLVRSIPQVEEGLDRTFENLSRVAVRSRGNLSGETEAGDVISFGHEHLGTHLPARVDRITDTQVDLTLLVEDQETISFRDWWNATVFDVTNETFSVAHDAERGLEVVSGDSVGRVTRTNASAIVVDFNDPRAGRTMVYDVELDAIERVETDRDLWSRQEDPVPDDGRIHDVAMVAQTMPTIATTDGIYFTPDLLGENWFASAIAMEGREVRALEASPAGTGTVFASVVGDGVMVSHDHGRTWSTPAGEGLPSAPRDLTRAGGEEGALYALMDDGDLLRSDDGGATWSASGSAPGGVQGIDGGFASSEEIWAGTRRGVKRSMDGGSSWEQRGLEFFTVRDVVALSNRTVLSMAGQSLYVSFDRGDHWSSRSGNIEGRRVDITVARPAWVLTATGERSGAVSQDSGGSWRSFTT